MTPTGGAGDAHPDEALLGSVAPGALVSERLVLHLAVQPIAAVAEALLGTAPDHGQGTLAWEDEREAFVSRDLGGGVRLALEADALQLLVLDDQGRVRTERALVDATLAETLAGTVADLSELGLDAGAARLDLEAPRLTEHRVARGGAFAPGDPAARAELARWFAAARRALLEVTGGETHASEPRVWPHHLDLGQLVLLDPELGPRRGRSVGLGLSPGDAYLDEPYLYCTPYPRPRGIEPPDVDGGRWEHDAFFGAVLPASEALASGGGAALAMVRFYASAYSLCRALLREVV